MEIKEAIRLCDSESYIYPDILDSSIGLGRHETVDVIGIISWDRKNKGTRRKIIIKITTFRGISSDAVHFYAKLIVDGVYTANINDLDKCENVSRKQEQEFPELGYKYNFNIRRIVNQAEIDLNPKMWEYYDGGDQTDRFTTKLELISHATELIKLRFTGDWDVFVEHPRGDMEKLNIFEL